MIKYQISHLFYPVLQTHNLLEIVSLLLSSACACRTVSYLSVYLATFTHRNQQPKTVYKQGPSSAEDDPLRDGKKMLKYYLLSTIYFYTFLTIINSIQHQQQLTNKNIYTIHKLEISQMYFTTHLSINFQIFKI